MEFSEGVVGTVYYKMKMPTFSRNVFMKFVQAGAQATIVDICSGNAFIGFDTRPAVSVNLTFDYISRVEVNKEYVIKVEIQKIGKKIGFSKTYFLDPHTNEICLSANHVIAFTSDTPKL